MPQTKSAKGALKKSTRNRGLNLKYKKAIKEAKKTLQKSIIANKKEQTTKALNYYYKALDKGVKKNILHKNKVARLKSQAAKSLKQMPPLKKETKKQKNK